MSNMTSSEIRNKLDSFTTAGCLFIRDYLKNKGGYLKTDSPGRDKMYCYIFNYDLDCNIEFNINAMKLEDDMIGFCINDPDKEEDWYFWDIYWLPTVQSVLEGIEQY